jgi:uncharacterized RmlC-like cupin family protein
MVKAVIGRTPPAKVEPVLPAAKKKAVDGKIVKDRAASDKAAATRQDPVAKAQSPKKVTSKKTSIKGPASRKADRVAHTQTTPAVRKATPSGPASPIRAASAKAAAETVSVNKAATRRVAARTTVSGPPARRIRAVAPPRARSAASPARKTAVDPVTTEPRKSSASKPQIFTVSHLHHADFKADGLRAYAQYRDLGIAAATGGLCQAHVIRFTPPCTDEVRKPHLHEAELQLIYVLQGWMKNAFDGHGEQMMSTGSCWLQPSGIRHTVLDYSADCEVLEIIIPADFKTEELI